MGFPLLWGRIAFFAVPLLLWLLGTSWIKRSSHGGWSRKALAFVVGGDGRLSLSRLQAFLWTMVIFGAYAAATVVHERYTPASTAGAALADSAAREARTRAAGMKATAAVSRARTDESRAARATASSDAEVARELMAQLARDTLTPGMRPAFDAARTASITAAATAGARATAARTDSVRAAADSSAAAAAERVASGLEADAASKRWVGIPASLLALAGIALGSGILSSLISAATGEGKTACATALEVVRYRELDREAIGSLGVADSPDSPCAKIHGSDLGSSGRVRFGSTYADVLHWRSDGSLLVVEVPAGYYESPGTAALKYRIPGRRGAGTLVIETPNGKLAYELRASGGRLVLGPATSVYDFVDLFRDDKNPVALDLMKFQMFGWTLLAITIYVTTFLWALHSRLTELPTVDASLVILTGLSQTGYLTGKAVSVMGGGQGAAGQSAAAGTPVTNSGTPPEPQLPAPPPGPQPS